MARSPMTAVVLAGGEGKRLRPYTTVLPKPLMPLGEQSILEIVLRRLAAAGFEKVVLSVGFLSELIEAFAGDGSRFGLDVRYVRESVKLGTAGPLALIEDLPDPVLVMNGDVLTDIDFAGLIRHHNEVGAAATMGVTRRSTLIDFGVLETSEAGDITGWVEKPSIESLISIGVNVFSSKAIGMLSPGEPCDVPQLISELLTSGERVATYEFGGVWLDIGRKDDYERAMEMIEADPGRFLPGGRG